MDGFCNHSLSVSKGLLAFPFQCKYFCSFSIIASSSALIISNIIKMSMYSHFLNQWKLGRSSNVRRRIAWISLVFGGLKKNKMKMKRYFKGNQHSSRPSTNSSKSYSWWRNLEFKGERQQKTECIWKQLPQGYNGRFSIESHKNRWYKEWPANSK